MNVVLLHAFPLDPSMWEPQREALRDHDVVAPTLYGRGDTLDAWASSLLDELEGERLVLVGASMGGYCALAMARLAPERVAGLLLAGSRAGADTPERRATRDAIARTLREEGVAAWLDRSGNRAPREIVLQQSAVDLANAMEVLRERADATDVVATFDAPFLLVVGSEDELLSVEEAREIVALAPAGRLEVVEGAGHIVSADRPERFNEILTRFLARSA